MQEQAVQGRVRSLGVVCSCGGVIDNRCCGGGAHGSNPRVLRRQCRGEGAVRCQEVSCAVGVLLVGCCGVAPCFLSLRLHCVM